MMEKKASRKRFRLAFAVIWITYVFRFFSLDAVARISA